MESIELVLEYFNTYGAWLVFIIVYLEYLNMAGLPSGIIMPAAGALIAQSEYSFMFIFSLSVLGGILGSISLYYIGYFVGNPVLKWMYEKFPKSRKSIDKATGYHEKYGTKAVFISRLVPVIRTIISLIAGAFRVDIKSFVLYSTPGISIWNFVLILSGYITTKAIL